ncbi:MAG: polysaccharide biosynthesis protein [Terricaulis sp.]
MAGSAEAVAVGERYFARENVSLRLLGVALIGPSQAPTALPVLSRAADWAGFDPAENKSNADTLILVEQPPSRAAARTLLARAAHAQMNVMLLEHGVLRPMTIGDVIGRALASVDWERIRATIAGKRILITGGGGSIGGELARRVATLGPASLCILENSEFNLFAIGRELPNATLALADIRDEAAVKRWFAREKPEIIFHAAALKQVPLVEAHPCEGVRTNVGATRIVADAAAAIGAHMIFVSTDKAVNPSGVMGATKRLAEMYCQALDRESAGSRFLTVRLGNVLGSTGSVTPLFENQIASGGPLTVTDPSVTRFFITIPQAADCLLQAAAAGIASRSGRGAAFVLDMGEPLAVVELARKMIQLKGLRPDVDIDITFVGLRPGEKLHEELVASDEWREANPASGVMAAASSPRGLADLNETIDRLTMLARTGADADVTALLHAAVAPGKPSEEADRPRVAAAG